MKRQKRQWGRVLLIGLTVLSLLLAIATATLWVRSVFVWDCFERYPRGEYAAIVLRSGEVHYTSTSTGLGSAYFAVLRDKGPAVSTPSHLDWRHRTSSDDLIQNPFITNRFLPSTPYPFAWKDHGSGDRGASIALWFPLITFSIPPLSRLTQSMRRLARLGHCPACGYDIRANPTRCSECGHKPKPVTT